MYVCIYIYIEYIYIYIYTYIYIYIYYIYIYILYIYIYTFQKTFQKIGSNQNPTINNPNNFFFFFFAVKHMKHFYFSTKVCKSRNILKHCILRFVYRHCFTE